MYTNEKHILICGGRSSGKRQLVDRLIAECRVPVYGYRSRVVKTRADGYHEIYMLPADGREIPLTEENHIGDCDTRRRTVNPGAFDGPGVRLLDEAKPGGMIVMDEIGFMEAEAKLFCEKVLSCLDGDIPVLATVKSKGPDLEFLRKVKSHPRAVLYDADKTPAEELYKELSEIVRGWNERLSEC